MASAADCVFAVKFEAPNAPTMVIESYVLRAAGEFCERALVWTEWISPIALVSAERDYAVTTPADARVVCVRGAKAGGRELRGGEDFMLATIEPPVLRLAETPINPPAGSQLELRVTYAPTPTAATLPALLTTRYLYALAAGAKRELLRVRNQSWSDPVRAAECGQEFEDAIAKARAEFEMAYSAGESYVAPREFGR